VTETKNVRGGNDVLARGATRKTTTRDATEDDREAVTGSGTEAANALDDLGLVAGIGSSGQGVYALITLYIPAAKASQLSFIFFRLV
jgi:hypothetical protein